MMPPDENRMLEPLNRLVHLLTKKAILAAHVRAAVRLQHARLQGGSVDLDILG